MIPTRPAASPIRRSTSSRIVAALGDNPMAAAYLHLARALAAALFDYPELERHAAAALPRPHPGVPTDGARALLRALALARPSPTPRPGSRGAADRPRRLPRLAGSPRRRCPGNFRHLLRLSSGAGLGAGWLRTAARAFDAALRERRHAP